MKAIDVTARLLDAREKPVQQLVVSLQMFATKARKWGQIAQAATDATGLVTFRIEADALQDAGEVAPLLRLVEPGGPGERVLASGGMVQFDARSQVLTLDFGEIERLEDSAFAALPTARGTTADTMAGMLRKPGISQGTVLHNLTVDRSLGRTLSTTRLDPDAAANPRMTAAASQVLSAELTTLRSTSVEKDALLARSDQALQAERVKSAAAEARIAALERQPVVGVALGDLTAADELTVLRSQTLEKDRVILRKDQDLVAARLEADQTSIKLAEQTRAHRLALERIAELEAAPVTGAVKSADIQTVFTQIGTKMGDANTALKAQATPFRLGAIKIDLRGPMTEDGRILLGNAAVQNGSGVSAELHSDAPRDGSDAQVRVPEVTGLTESAVRRVLRSVGLRLKSATQAAQPGAGTPGQALTQHPAAGQPAAHGAEILVVFAALPVA